MPFSLHQLDFDSSSSIATSLSKNKMQVLTFLRNKMQTNINKHLDSKTYAMILKFYHDLTNLQFDIQNVKKND
jgi:hypothetical protein